MSKKFKFQAVIAAVFLFSVLGFTSLMIPSAKAATSSTWDVYSGEITLDNQPYVVDASVTYNGSGYEMWYTHGELSITSYINAAKSLNLTSIIADITSLDFDSLMSDLSDLDAATLAGLLADTNAAIGYATSSDGKTWTTVDTAVLGGSGDTYKRVGTPSVTNNGSGYEMWYTNFTTDLTQTDIQNLQTGLAGDAAARKTAIVNLLHSIDMSIGYATSPDGITWTVVNPSALSGSGSLLDSYFSPSVTNNGSGYEMWYTRLKTDVTGTDLDAILADIGNFGATDLWDILDGTTAVIGYATSTDGETWVDVNPQVFPATSGGIWDSVSSPCVIETGGSYEMWYTSTETDLTSANVSDLLNEISNLSFASLWNSLKTMNLDDFFIELLGTDISNIKDILSGTSSSIGYATSSDGITWTVDDAKLINGNGGISASIGAPTVVKTASAYEMWYSEGIPDITLQNVVSLLDGSHLPIGYASLTTGATVEISVVLEGPGRPDGGWVIPLNVKFCTPGTSDVIYSFNQTTVKVGSTAVANVTGIAPGVYDIYVSSNHTLANVRYDVTISKPSTSVDMGTLLEGNANNDVQVTLADFNILKSVFFSTDPVADFDRSGQVTLADFNLLKANFFKSSPIDITP